MSSGYVVEVIDAFGGYHRILCNNNAELAEVIDNLDTSYHISKIEVISSVIDRKEVFKIDNNLEIG